MSENILQTQINQILEIVKSHDNRFNAIEERIDVLSEQIRQLDKQHGERLAKLEVITLGHDSRIDKLTDKVDSMYKWIIGLLLPMWASIIIAILLK